MARPAPVLRTVTRAWGPAPDPCRPRLVCGRGSAVARAAGLTRLPGGCRGLARRARVPPRARVSAGAVRGSAWGGDCRARRTGSSAAEVRDVFGPPTTGPVPALRPRCDARGRARLARPGRRGCPYGLPGRRTGVAVCPQGPRGPRGEPARGEAVAGRGGSARPWVRSATSSTPRPRARAPARRAARRHLPRVPGPGAVSLAPWPGSPARRARVAADTGAWLAGRPAAGAAGASSGGDAAPAAGPGRRVSARPGPGRCYRRGGEARRRTAWVMASGERWA